MCCRWKQPWSGGFRSPSSSTISLNSRQQVLPVSCLLSNNFLTPYGKRFQKSGGAALFWGKLAFLTDFHFSERFTAEKLQLYN